MKRGHRFALAAGMALLTLIIIEGLLRRFPPPISDRLFQPNADFGKFHIPGRQGYERSTEFTVPVKINSRGLRDTEHAYEKPSGVCRVLILGDSFPEGLQVPLEDTVGRKLEGLLNTRGRHPYEVINAGVAGFGTDTELLFYRLEGRRYHPDLVLLFFYQNDLADNGAQNYFRLDNGTLKPAETRPEAQDSALAAALRGWLWDHFVVIRVLGNAWYDAQAFARGAGNRLSPKADPASAMPMPGAIDSEWSLTTALLAELDRETTADSAHLVVIGIPDARSMDSNEPQQDIRTDQVNHQLGEVAAHIGIDYIDLLPVFSSQPESTRAALYWPLAKHWTSAGHKLAAQIVFDALATNGWLAR